MRAASRFILPALAAALPRVALACPACARHESSALAVAAISAMIAAPFVLAGVVFAVVRRGEAPPEGER